uniref:Uncharacterized protein n=1 Tax=Zea mays TaxID=4577 RepID=A0A804MI48_MAIZE
MGSFKCLGDWYGTLCTLGLTNIPGNIGIQFTDWNRVLTSIISSYNLLKQAALQIFSAGSGALNICPVLQVFAGAAGDVNLHGHRRGCHHDAVIIPFVHVFQSA